MSDWTEICRLEAGRVELVRQDADLADVIDRAVVEARPRIRVKEQRLRVQLPNEPALVKADARALQRVVDNLLSNAIKYTAPHGSILMVVELSGDDWVRLDVVDTGIGLREEDQARLFHKFFRSTLTEAEPGTGLGLAICLGLLELMGGSIEVTSALGRGSTFSVLLPRVARQGGSPAVPASMPAVASAKKAASVNPPAASPVGCCSEA